MRQNKGDDMENEQPSDMEPLVVAAESFCSMEQMTNRVEPVAI